MTITIRPHAELRMKDRRIGRGEVYKPIYASGIEPQHLAISDIQKLQDEETTVFKGLHKLLPFPPNYVKEVLRRTGLNETTEFSKVDEQKPEELFNVIRRIYDEHHSTPIKPRIVLDPEGKAIDVIPALLHIYEKYPQQEFQTFNEALDEYFSSLYLEKIQKESTSPQKSKIEEIERIITQLTEEEKNIEREELLEVLSHGERKALYLLNIIFEVEARKKSNQKTLFIIDDIADSFDYKNKYAIIEYLKDISKEDNFYQIILTHNFDFFRSIEGRFVGRSNCQMVIKTTDKILIEDAEYLKPFEYFKNNLHTNNKILIASIPFVRNLAGYHGPFVVLHRGELGLPALFCVLLYPDRLHRHQSVHRHA